MRPTLIILLILAMFAVATGSAFQARRKIAKNIAQNNTSSTTDFDRWVGIIPHRLATHEDILDDQFPNPPPAMLILAPFAAMGRANAATAWAFCKPLFALAILYFGYRILKNAGGSLSTPAVLLIAAAWFWPFLGDTQEGQTNLLMLLPLAAALLLAQNERPGAQFTAGMLLALAITIKVTPIFFLFYFAYRLRLNLLLGAAVGLVLWMLLVPGLFVGFHQIYTWDMQWARVMLFPYAGSDSLRNIMGSQSLPSLLLRLLKHVPAFDFQRGPEVHYLYLNFLDLSDPVIKWIVRLALGGIALVGLYWIHPRLPNFNSRRYLKEIACIALFMIWSSHWAWIPHYVTAIFALIAVGNILSDPAESPRIRKLAFYTLLATDLLMLLTSDISKLIPPYGNKLVRAVAVCFWATFLLALLIIRSKKDHAALTPLQSPASAATPPPVAA